MTRRLSLLSTILLGYLFNLTFAIEIKTSHHYYKVNPTRPGHVYNNIVVNSPPSTASYLSSESQLKTLGEYTPIVNLNVAYDVYNYLFFQRCTVAEVDYHLHSQFLLPELDESLEYDEATRDRFRYELGRIERHENRHEQHWINGLEDLKSRVMATGRKKQNCDELKDRIYQMESDLLKQVKQQDLRYDCRTYGSKLGLPECNAL